MTQNTGGPAFPAAHYDLSEGEHGLTVRDYFAAKCMQGCLSGAKLPGLVEKEPGTMALVQKLAVGMYVIADAMLAARAAAATAQTEGAA